MDAAEGHDASEDSQVPDDWGQLGDKAAGDSQHASGDDAHEESNRAPSNPEPDNQVEAPGLGRILAKILEARNALYGPHYMGQNNAGFVNGMDFTNKKLCLGNIPWLSRVVVIVMKQLHYTAGKSSAGSWTFYFPRPDGLLGVSRAMPKCKNEKSFWDCLAQQVCFLAVSPFCQWGKMFHAPSGSKFKEFAMEAMELQRDVNKLMQNDGGGLGCLLSKDPAGYDDLLFHNWSKATTMTTRQGTVHTLTTKS